MNTKSSSSKKATEAYSVMVGEAEANQCLRGHLLLWVLTKPQRLKAPSCLQTPPRDPHPRCLETLGEATFGRQRHWLRGSTGTSCIVFASRLAARDSEAA